MRKTLYKLLAAALPALLWVAKAEAKSIVFTLNSGTQVYYQLQTDTPPRMVIGQDGTFTMNGQPYAFDDVKCFAYSATDYDGESGTLDGMAAMEEGKVRLQGEARIYTTDGRLVRRDGDLSPLRAGTYIVSDGTTTLKIRKQ